MIDYTFAIGFNHHHTNASQRSRFALNADQQSSFYQQGLHQGLQALCILNTCNRTEIFGCGDITIARRIYLDLIGMDASETSNLIQLKGRPAIEHIFKVACGLDSQIIGDLEILGQFKQAFKNAKEQHALNGYLERLANASIQAAKAIKTHTKISSGTVTLSYAAIKFIKHYLADRPCKVLVIGIGDFGNSIACNLKKYLPNASLFLTNRTDHKALELAATLGCSFHPYAALSTAIEEANVIVSSVGNIGGYLIGPHNVSPSARGKFFIDMSVPLSIDPAICAAGHCRLVTLDDVNQEVKQTMETRKEDLPLALRILEQHVNEFCDWAAFLTNADTIKKWKNMMHDLSESCPYLKQFEEKQKDLAIKKSMKEFTAYLRSRQHFSKDGDQIIQHFLLESRRAVACESDCATSPTIKCHTCQIR